MKKLPYAKLVAYINSKCNYLTSSQLNFTNCGILCANGILIKSEWLNRNKEYSWVKPPTLENDKSTFDGCRIIVTLTIWDGDSFDGFQTTKRCSFDFQITKDSPCLEFIRQNIKTAIEYKASQMYKKELDDIKNARIKELSENLIGVL
jgi:hypothetical protein